MAKAKLQSVYNLSQFLKEEAQLPIYFFCGEDSFAINGALAVVEKAFSHLVESEFDKEILSVEKGDKTSIITDTAYAFPFGTGKKILVVKNYNNISDEKTFAEYVKNPSDTTIIILTYHKKIKSSASEPFKSLIAKGFLFDAAELKGANLVNWLQKHTARNKLKISLVNAQALVDIVGEDKYLLEMQIQKFYDYLGPEKEITQEVINELSSVTKEFNVFDLQNAIAKADISASLEIAYNLLDSGQELTFIISMLTKFFTTISHSIEMVKQNVDDNEAAKKNSISPFYYRKCKEARFFRNDKRMLKVVRALLEADLNLKTTAMEPKLIISIFISQILK